MSRPDKPTVVDGIEVDVTAEDLDDFEITEAIGDITDEGADDGAKVAATVRLMRLAFKDEFPRIKRELRQKNGGRLTNETMVGFANAVFEAVGRKN